jgi:hypothetical protein
MKSSRMCGRARRSLVTEALWVPASMAPRRMANPLKPDAMDAKQNEAIRPVRRWGVPKARCHANCAASMRVGRPSQMTSAVAHTGRAARRRCVAAPMSPAATVAKMASTNMARTALCFPERRLVAKNVAARSRALMAAAFQFQVAMSVAKGRRAIPKSAGPRCVTSLWLCARFCICRNSETHRGAIA